MRPDDRDMADIRLVVQMGRQFGRFTLENVGEYLLEEVDALSYTEDGSAVDLYEYQSLKDEIEDQRVFFRGMDAALSRMRESPPFMAGMLGEDDDFRLEMLIVAMHVTPFADWLMDMWWKAKHERVRLEAVAAEEARQEAKRQAEAPDFSFPD